MQTVYFHINIPYIFHILASSMSLIKEFFSLLFIFSSYKRTLSFKQCELICYITLLYLLSNIDFYLLFIVSNYIDIILSHYIKMGYSHTDTFLNWHSYQLSLNGYFIYPIKLDTLNFCWKTD